jgi:hypothetical protein
MARYEEIELNGEKFPIMFSMRIILEFCRNKNIPFQEFTGKMQEVFNDPDLLEHIVWLGFKAAHKFLNKTEAFTLKESTVLHVDAHVFTKYINMINTAFVGDGGNPQGAETAKANKGKKLKAVKA